MTRGREQSAETDDQFHGATTGANLLPERGSRDRHHVERAAPTRTNITNTGGGCDDSQLRRDDGANLLQNAGTVINHDHLHRL